MDIESNLLSSNVPQWGLLGDVLKAFLIIEIYNIYEYIYYKRY